MLTPNATARCIFKNMVILISVSIIFTLLTKLVPSVDHLVSTTYFRNASFGAMIFALVLILMGKRSRTLLWVVFGATLASLMVIAQLSETSAVIQALVMTLFIFGCLTYFGYNLQAPLRGQAFFVTALIGLIVISLINLFVGSSPLQTAIAIASALIFSALTVYDTQRFARFCKGDDCCTRGTLSLWLDFVNLFSDILYLQR